MMHRDRDLRLELCQDFSGEVRVHGAPAAYRRQGNVDLAEGFDLLLIELLAQVAQVGDAQGS